MDNGKNREIEVKILLDNNVIFGDIDDILSCYPHEKWQEYHMLANYIDTIDGDLDKNQVAYRIRQENEKIVATLKSGAVDEKGVAYRYEVNKNVNSLEPDLMVFSDDEKFGTILQSLKAKKLVSKLKMDFIRQANVFTYNDAKIEVAVDRGVIIKGSKEAPIWELELELKEGAVAELVKFKDLIVNFFQLTVATKSKYARGLEL